MPVTSLCSTNYNTSPVTLRSLESVLRFSEGLDREVVIVDNYSTDGSYEALSAYPTSVPVRLLRRRCSRGLGRELAFEASRGDYVVTFDLDTIYNSNWGRLVRWVVSNQIPFELEAVLTQCFPRSVLEQVDGWKDLQCREDLDLSNRVAARGLYRDYPVICGENLKRRYSTNLRSKWFRYYRNHRDQIAVDCWIPLSLYLRGYLAWIRRDPRGGFLLSIFAPAYLAALRKRKQLQINHKDFSAMMDPSVRIDCEIVPREELRYAWRYATRSMCEEALDRGDLGFLPSSYE